jgi:hypothetical protein
MRKKTGFPILEQDIIRVPAFGRAQRKLIIAGFPLKAGQALQTAHFPIYNGQVLFSFDIYAFIQIIIVLINFYSDYVIFKVVIKNTIILFNKVRLQ